MQRDSYRTVLLGALLLAFNIFIVRELFITEYTVHIGSIEAAFISIARHISANWGNLTWFPLWYGGIPFYSVYNPLLHVIVAGLASTSGISAALSYHFATAAFYCIGPITLFWMAFRLSGSRAYGLAAGLLYSVVSPSVLLIGAVREDAGGFFSARRLQALVHYGEGPHVASLSLLPLAIVLLDIALKRRTRTYYVLAALAMAAVPLTNWFGAVTLAMAVLAYLLSSEKSGFVRTWAIVAGIGLLSYALICPWIPPSAALTVSKNSQTLEGDFRYGFPQLAFALLIVLGAMLLHYSLRVFRAERIFRFAAIYSWLVGAIVLGWEWWRLNLLPQPARYHLGLEIGLVLLVVSGFRKALAPMLARRTAVGLAAIALVLVFQARNYRYYAWNLIRPLDITETVEYKAAKWFESNIPGQRVMVGGSTGYWLNAFTDNPQLAGGTDQNITNPLLRDVLYQIYTGTGAGAEESEIAEIWLKAFGVRAVAVQKDYYQAFANPKKFEGQLKELWRDGEDAIYEVPHRPASLAHVVYASDLLKHAPASALDVELLKAYIAALENPELPLARFEWTAPGRARIDANLTRGQVLSIQVTHDPGWAARVNGESRKLMRDSLGLMYLEPGCSGQCIVEMEYDGGPELKTARIISLTAMLGAALWIAAGFRKRQASARLP